jgi:hypothetical protein
MAIRYPLPSNALAQRNHKNEAGLTAAEILGRSKPQSLDDAVEHGKKTAAQMLDEAPGLMTASEAGKKGGRGKKGKDSLSLSKGPTVDRLAARIKRDATDAHLEKTKALHLAMQSLGSEPPVSLSSPAGVCYPKVVLQARLIGIGKKYGPQTP